MRPPPSTARCTATGAVTAALDASGLLADRLSVEVTESVVRDDDALDELKAMARLGVHLTMDDVGTDWSVLEFLEHLPVDTIKIDRALVERIGDADTADDSNAATIIDLSRSLRICSVAEGIESQEQLDFLRRLGAEVGQGCFFSPPVAGREAFALAALGYTPRYALDRPRAFVPSPVVPAP